MNKEKILIAGIGQAGTNIVNHLIDSKKLKDVEFCTMNTDLKCQKMSLAKNNILLGKNLTQGLSAGAIAHIGKYAALDAKDEIKAALSGFKTLIITAGLGGGTGSGASPVVAEIAKQNDILVLALVTLPFGLEGEKHFIQAHKSLKKLRKSAYCTAAIENDKAIEHCKPIKAKDAYEYINECMVDITSKVIRLLDKKEKMKKYLRFEDFRRK